MISTLMTGCDAATSSLHLVRQGKHGEGRSIAFCLPSWHRDCTSSIRRAQLHSNLCPHKVHRGLKVPSLSLCGVNGFEGMTTWPLFSFSFLFFHHLFLLPSVCPLKPERAIMGRLSKHKKHKAIDPNGRKSKGQLLNDKEKQKSLSFLLSFSSSSFIDKCDRLIDSCRKVVDMVPNSKKNESLPRAFRNMLQAQKDAEGLLPLCQPLSGLDRIWMEDWDTL